MAILSIISNAKEFKVTGDPDGKFILQTQYGYECVPHHPENKSYFICFSETKWDFLNGSKITFKSTVSFQYDIGNKKPKTEALLAMSQHGNSLMNSLLNVYRQEKTYFDKLEISPINQEETLSVLEECVLLAYPQN
jgi:hypothetical protein